MRVWIKGSRAVMQGMNSVRDHSSRIIAASRLASGTLFANKDTLR